MPTPPTLTMPVDKSELVQELLAQLTREVLALEETHRETRAGATHEEAKPENDKDTRALEQSYLARGQALRIQELREVIARVRSTGLTESDGAIATLGSLVTVRDEEDETVRRFLLMPGGGGSRLAEARALVLVVTPESPWGTALVGSKVGDAREVRVAGALRDFVVVAIA